MKIKIFIIISLFTLKISSQEFFNAKYKVSLSKINYENSFKDKKKTSINERIMYTLNRNQNEYIRVSEKVEFNLDFDNKSSVFSVKKILDSEDEKYYKGFLRELSYRGKYFKDSLKMIHQKNSYGENFLISVPKLKWEILNTTKKIGKYLCYKATTIKTVENSRGVHKLKITAWFTSTIPYSYGPREFVGLPGLILELQDGRKTYKLISLKKIKYKEIKKPTKGKEITEKEFNALSKKMYENRGN